MTRASTAAVVASAAGSATTLAIPGREVAVRVRRSRRARRLALRLDPASGEVELVLPRGVGLRQAEGFLERQRDWLFARLDRLPPRIPFADGAVLPVLGRDCLIRHRPRLPVGVRRERDELLVGGPAAELAPPLRAWFRATARAVLVARAAAAARRIDRTVVGVAIRDPKSRWGSCSTGGRLSFSWRLLFAPDAVLDYVVAHEVAHLREGNHGPRFWALVEALCPGHHAPRAWLQANGARLHRYG